MEPAGQASLAPTQQASGARTQQASSARNWVLLQPAATALAALERGGHAPLLARLLSNRGIDTPDAAAAFLTPPLRDLPDPDLMADCAKAAACVTAAILRGDRICIYGDYDVDGISAAALLHTFFALVGHPVQVFLPDRFRDGYGLHEARLLELADAGAQLFISVDCGTTAVREIAAVRARGIDFIVCDHHALGPQLPDATAILNPRRPDCQYPDKFLCAVGVALVLAQGIRRELERQGWQPPGGTRLDLKSLLEFAALGTIADMVPLRHVNRTLAWHGLRMLGTSKRAGIVALAAQGGPQGHGADRVGFHLGPRINAAGRVADARTAFQLLTTGDAVEARTLADRIEVENNRRKTLQAEVTVAALHLAAGQPGREDAIVVADATWHQGVVGIVAARVKDVHGVPAFVLAVGEDGIARGSGRSVPGYDLTVGLHACCGDGLAERYGGHAFAAGISIRADRLDTFRERLVRHVAETLPRADRGRELLLDAELELASLQMAILEPIERLEPFGKGNHRPQFLLRGVEIADLQTVGKTQEWVRCKLLEPGDTPAWARLAVAAFGPVAAFEGWKRGDRVDAVVRLERNSHNGKQSLQATVEALAPVGGVIGTRAA